MRNDKDPDKDSFKRELGECGFDDWRIEVHMKLLVLGEEFEIDFHGYYVFGEATAVYDLAVTEAGKRLAYSLSGRH